MDRRHRQIVFLGNFLGNLIWGLVERFFPCVAAFLAQICQFLSIMGFANIAVGILIKLLSKEKQ
jgi:hypothetical protein